MASLRFFVENTTTITIWHLQDSNRSPVEMPLFYACLAFVALNNVHTSTEAKIEAIVGPSLCHALLQTSGLLFCCPISNPIQEGQRRAGIWPSKSHSPSCWALAAWHRDNEVVGEEATAPRNRSGLNWRRGSKWNRAHEPPLGAVCVHKLPPKRKARTARHQRLQQRGQIVEEWVWNNSCSVNQHRIRHWMLNIRAATMWRGEALTRTVNALHRHHQQTGTMVTTTMKLGK